MLNHVKALLAWRRQRPALVTGELRFEPTAGPVLAFRRQSSRQSVWCAFNFSGQERACEWRGNVLGQFGAHGACEASRVLLGPYGFVLLEENIA